MDPSCRDYWSLMNGIGLQSVNDHAIPVVSNSDYVNGLPILGSGFAGLNSNSDFRDYDAIPDASASNISSLSSASHEGNLHEDYDFSDSVMRYINQILVEEDVEGKSCMLQESLHHQALQDANKSMYDGIRTSYRPQVSLDSNPKCLSLNPSYGFLNSESLNSYLPDESYGCRGGIDNGQSVLGDPKWVYGMVEFGSPEVENNQASYQTLATSYKSTSLTNVMDVFLDSPISTLQVPNLYNGSRSISQFNKGVEEAGKFLPSNSELVLSVGTNMLEKISEDVPKKLEMRCVGSSINSELNEGGDVPGRPTRGRKHFGHSVDIEGGRSNKQAATYNDSDVRSDMFDKVLLSYANDKNELIVSLRTSLQRAAAKKTEQIGLLKGRGRKQVGKKEVVDLRTLLINCAQAVAADNRRTANELLKQIRQNSSTLGDGTQRLAHYMANGLEARLAGTGSQIYRDLTSERTSAADVLKAYLLYLAACPFRKLSNFFSNKNIAKRARRASRIHIIDFGILYGFQWPHFIQRQSMREGGPPRIKITGIDFPQPGFRPAERVEETGLRLENYAHEFRVPFEYRAIAKRWDAIQLEDFDIDEDEVLIVNCTYRMKNLPDETVSVENSRNNVLKLIRKLRPDLFIHGVVNGSYNAPFFVTRFKEALFHFSAQFDMLETIVPRDYGERMLIERDLLAKEALNVVACEGWERVERPETYKQWQVRTVRAGFSQLPLDSEIKDRAMMLVRSGYHHDFVIDEDSRWLLLGWKGRIIFALSTWQPT